ncbi:DUF2382 domain-containing protein [Chlorogloea sp. CCALA 695]|uniref:DUF2382 domain-containing protein n=1 Tax=Chlorogloea sp. CCALA 695 TaxID=2107693 RepID=UPI000D07F245|nr:DUF2382 domain-containing protein [Chlorogloea sp. CCALA 695]PSB32028.1 photosystem reaction center subunit H [Chlorogloea sp. CCALA 695]
MPLHLIKDFDPDYLNHFENQSLLGYDLYSGNEKVGSIDNLLVDDNGKFRYLIVSTGIWIFGKKVLLPIGRAQINNNERRVYVNGLTRSQAEQLPQYQDGMSVDYEQEEQVRSVYRPLATASLDASAPLDTAAVAYNRDTYGYEHEPALYDLNEQNHQNLKLYEERLIANKTRQKTGEVAIGKRVETETAKVSMPIEKERVVIERTTPSNAGATVTPGTDAFGEDKVARIEVYEETPDIRKEAFVREEVSVRKEVDQETVQAEEMLRREELDVNTEGRPVVDKGTDSRSSKKSK